MRNRYKDMIPSCHLIFASDKNEKEKNLCKDKDSLHKDISRPLGWQNNSDYFLPVCESYSYQTFSIINVILFTETKKIQNKSFKTR